MAPALDHVDDEMHELNLEADYLDQTVTVDHNGVSDGQKGDTVINGHNDADAQAQVIDSLRTQVQDLFSQVSQLNGKLVRSYDRVSDLEDELHVTAGNLRNTTLKVSQLELERTQHMSALSTGLLVEKDHVTTELNRLMEKATEEAAKAGEAVSARVAIEKDLDDLSANLFHQANTMVAEARFARAQSERKVEETERALKGAEEVVGVLQMQMQALQADKEQANKDLEEMRMVMGKGKWIDRSAAQSDAPEIHFLNLHSPYNEYMAFIGHLRTIRPATQVAPAMSTLLPLPFLARLIAEDSDPTIRLDLAPSLNWLTRRSVLSAIHSGQLNVEPMSTSTLLEELNTHATSGLTPTTHVTCALCGTNIVDTTCSPTHTSPLPYSPTRAGSFGKPGWGSSFLKSSLQTISQTPFGQHSPHQASHLKQPLEPPSQVYIFRLESTASSGLPVSLPLASQQNGTQTRTATIYPLCTSGWCLTRLRTTCSLWAFIRTSVVEKIWEDEPYVPPPVGDSLEITAPGAIDRPSTPVKKTRMGIGALWGTVSRSLSTTAPERPSTPEVKPATDVKPTRHLPPPPPPPRHPSHTSSAATPPPPPPRRQPLTDSATLDSSHVAAPVPVHAHLGAPPPLPKRNRQRAESPAVPNGTHAAEKVAEPAGEGPDPAAVALSPPEEHVDEFTTPVEELPGQPSLDLIATDIPLPPSAPPTPVHAAPPTSRPPSRVGSPATDLAAAPGHPVPPPLPRRAAARARPTSMGLNPPITAPASGDDASELKSERVKPTEAEETAPNAVPEASVVETTSAPGTQDKAEDPKSEQEPTAEGNSAAVSEQAEPRRKSYEVPTVLSQSGPGSDPRQEDVSKLVVDSKAPALDVRIYVGTDTWEERTWRELMKLREDMFWARVGGVR
ncbi:hypothetical protein BC835DRAFT_1264923 [Cytidiella melzeri]|nr:hypothetical protein BC835DRAFT_1264923 [Cytidiella melzeri]